MREIGEADDNGGDHGDSDGDRGEAEADGVAARLRAQDNGEDLLKADKSDGGSASADGQEGPGVAELQNDEREGHESDKKAA